MKVWLNGAILPIAAARIDTADRGFTLGDGLFETIRAVDGQPAHLERHLRRLRAGAALLALPLARTDTELADAIALTLDANALTDAAIRLTVSRGPAPRGVMPPRDADPTVLVSAGALPGAAEPAYAIISKVMRRNEMSPLCRVKSLSYLDGVLARLEAADRGADEALLLNTQGRIAEATAANVFIVSGGTIVTPPVADGALPGIMREVLIERCGAVEAPLLTEDLLAADAAFLSNSLGLRPLASLGGRPLRARPALIAALWRRAA
jgi:branched-chain amino acid aminotransferase